MEKITEKVLGLDIGANSIGWALLEIPDENETSELLEEEYFKNGKILRCGVRIFPAGKEAFGTDKEKSVAEERGKLRRTRRRFKRLNQRKQNIRRILFEHGLLPSNNPDVMEHADSDPLKLRAEGLDKKLSLHDFGRAIYHINKRRGFLSVRKTRIKNSEEKKKTEHSEQTGETETQTSDTSGKEKDVKKIDILKNIQMLQDSITATGCRQLGEYLWSLRNQYGKDYRIRKRHTKRSMYIEEFNALWEKQKSFYTEVLTETLKKKLERELWFVRPIYWKQSTIGKCEYEPEEYCASRADRLAQEFRFYHEINNLTYWDEKDGEIRLAENPQWLEKIVSTAKTSATITFDQIRKIISGSEGTDIRFNLETGKKKKPKKGEPSNEEIKYRKELKAFETDAVMRKKEYFGNGWDNIPEEEKNKIVWVLTMRQIPSDPSQFTFKMEFEKDKNGKSTGRAIQISDADLRKYIAEHWTNYITLNKPIKGKEQDCIDNHIDAIVEQLPEEKELPKGYSNISHVAISKMLPFLRQGLLYSVKTKEDGSYNDAIHQAGYKRRDEKTDWTNWEKKKKDEKTGLYKKTGELYMPPLNEYLNEEKLTLITNPVVRRILTETRNLVNAIAREEGRPDFIVVELARDAKNSKLKRNAIAEQNLANQAAKKYAEHKIREMGEVPSAEAIERFRLWQEQGGVCPYTSIDEKRDAKKAESIQMKKNAGTKLTKEEEQWEINVQKRKTEADAHGVYSSAPISLKQLFSSEVDIDHIIPRAQMGEDTMLNKVLCFREANQEKGDCTPFEWLGEEGIKAVAARIRTMSMSPAKKVRLTSKTKVDVDEFTLRQMCDT
ncbi:MAG: hypothetical protein LBT09_11050, partial [Planctomycetaceae bacterium]|nr:hypothetical protein [Planctomycetaceae bacterium]